MRSLVFNFIKRFLLVPAVIAVAATVLLTSYMNSAADVSLNKLKPAAVGTVNLAGYSSSAYDSFSQLNNGDLIGLLSGEEIGLGETVVCYAPEKSAQLSMAEGSTAPWESGAMLIVGVDITSQLRAMHNAVIGSELTLDVSGKDVYHYTINRIDTGVTEEQLKTYFTDGTLAVAMPYKNLSGATAADYYLVFSAVQQ